MKAIWNGQVLAESNDTVVLENNHYFPSSSVNMKFFTKSATTSHCPWKGTASYFTIEADGDENKDAAWCYAAPMEAAAEIKDHVAFWRGVEVRE